MWMIREFCGDCLWSKEILNYYDGEDWEYCPSCGNAPSVVFSKVVHRVSDAKWYNPLTWFEWHWVDRHGTKYGVW